MFNNVFTLNTEKLISEKKRLVVTVIRGEKKHNLRCSRAHTIVAINFKQKSNNDAGKSMTKSSVINLVDLAGR